MASALVMFVVLYSIAGGESLASDGSPLSSGFVTSLNDLAKKGREANLNAAPCYEKAAGLYAREPQEIGFEELLRWPSELTDNHRLLLEQWISSNADALAQLTLGTQKPYHWAQHRGDYVFWPVRPK